MTEGPYRTAATMPERDALPSFRRARKRCMGCGARGDFTSPDLTLKVRAPCLSTCDEDRPHVHVTCRLCHWVTITAPHGADPGLPWGLILPGVIGFAIGVCGALAMTGGGG